MNDNLKRLYNSLKRDGYDIPAYDTFRSDMQDEGKMRKLHSNLKRDGYDIPDYNTFRSDMGFSATSAAATNTAAVQPASVDSSVKSGSRAGTTVKPVKRDTDITADDLMGAGKHAGFNTSFNDTDGRTITMGMLKGRELANNYMKSRSSVPGLNGGLHADTGSVSSVSDGNGSTNPFSSGTTPRFGTSYFGHKDLELTDSTAVAEGNRRRSIDRDMATSLDMTLPVTEWRRSMDDADSSNYGKPLTEWKSDATDRLNMGFESMRGVLSAFDSDDSAERAWQRADERTLADNNVTSKRAWDGYMDLGGGKEARMMSTGEDMHSRMVNHMTYHDLQRMSEDAWNMMDQKKRQDIVIGIYTYLRSMRPNADGASLMAEARRMAREESDRRLFELAVKKNAPQSATEYFFRRAIGQTSPWNLLEASVRADVGSTGDWEARYEAENRFNHGWKNKSAGIAGTVTGFVFDPLTFSSAGVGGFATKGTFSVGSKLIGQAAMRNFATRTSGKLLMGGIGAAANLGTYEAGSEAISQLRWGGSISQDPETGRMVVGDYDMGAVGESFLHGASIGAVTGQIAPLIGNVSNKAVRATNSTAGKLAIRGGEMGVGTLAEGTIFSIPDLVHTASDYNAYIDSLSDESSPNYIADEDERRRVIENLRSERGDAMLDVWTDGMAMMAGFKLHHVVKSAPRRIAELSAVDNPRTMEERNHNRMGFAERLRRSLDGTAPDLALTRDERAELDRGGYGDLGVLMADYEKLNIAKKRRDDVSPQLPYNRFAELMGDASISEAARAKMYYYLTGRVLPMSTVLSGDIRENRDAGGHVTGYTVESYGANGVVTSRTFDSRRAAEMEMSRIERQAELNTIDVGEQYYDWQSDSKRMEQACKNAAKQIAGDDWRFGGATLWRQLYHLMKRDPKGMNEAELEQVQRVIDAYNELGDRFEYEQYEYEGNGNILGVKTDIAYSGSNVVREDISNEFGVDVENAIRKDAGSRSKAEQDALSKYANQLFKNADRGTVFDGSGPVRIGKDMYVENDGMSAFDRGYDADESMRRDISIEASDPNNTEAQEAWDGAVRRMHDEADLYAAQQREQGRKMQHKDGTFRRATLKEQDDEGHDVDVYVVDGRVEMMDDGVTVDRKRSDETVVIYDPATDKRRMISPWSDTGIKSMGEVKRAEDFEADIERERQAYLQRLMDDATGTVRLRPGDQLVLPTGEDAMVVAIDADGEYITVQPADGMQSVVQRSELQRIADERAIADYRERYGIAEEQPGEAVERPATEEQRGEYVEGAPSEYTRGVELVVRDEDGSEKQVMVSARVRAVNNNGKLDYVPEENGPFVEYYVPGEKDPRRERPETLNEKVVGYVAPQQPESETTPTTTEHRAPQTDDERVIRDGIAGVGEGLRDAVNEQAAGVRENDINNWLQKPSVADVMRKYGEGAQSVEEVVQRALADNPNDETKAALGDIIRFDSSRQLVQGYISQPQPAQPAEAPAQPTEQRTAEPMPVREDGEEDWQATTPERAHAYIFNEAGLSRSEGNEFIAAQIQAAQSSLRKASSANMPRVGTSIRKYNEAKAKRQEKIDEAQRVLDYWNGVREIQNAIQREENERRAAEDAARHEDAVAQAQAEYEARKMAEAERKAVGNENPMPAITEKWNNATKVDGHRDEIMLPDGTALKGHYVLHESGASSPSHNPETWQKTDGFPMDANDNSVNDRDYERDLDAQEHTQSIARQYDQRALQNVPVVSSDGVVLSGNGRTMAGELAARDNSDGAYVDYLKEYAPKYGFTREQVDGMQHPRVSFVPDEAMPYTAETFSKFNQQEMKSQNKTEQAVKLGKTVSDDSFKGIVRTINGYDTLGDFYNDAEASLGAVYELRDAGVIPQAQLAEMVDGARGQEKLSAVGREFLENMLIGKAFEGDPDVVRMLTAEPAMRQSVINALGEIADNISLGDGWSLQQELSDAVRLCFDARKDGAKHGDIVSTFARQGVLFKDPDQLQTVADFNNATMLMLADVLNDKRVTLLKTTLQLYNNHARLSAEGQADLFAGGIRSREDILRDVINFINDNYGKRKEIDAARAAAVERRKAESVRQDGSAAAGSGGSENTGGSGRSKTSAERQGDLAQATVTAPLSEEVNEFDKPFVISSNGTTIFGEIGADSGLTAAPIKLSVGENVKDDNGTNHGYGLLHIEAGHGEQIRAAGFASVEEFVEAVARNYDTIREGGIIAGNQTYLLEISDEHNNTLFIQLSRDGSYWNVNSAGIFKKKYSRRKQEVFTRPALEPDTNTDTSGVDSGQSNGVTTPAGNSPQTSESKGKGNSSTSQAKGEKVAENQGSSSVEGTVDADEHRVNTEPTEAQKGEAGKDANEPTVLRLNGEEKSVGDIENTVMEHVQRIIDEGGFDAEIVGVKVIGSYMRGEQTSESDLDVLVEYRGKAKEDALFDALAEEGLDINGVNVDINPITKGKSGTIEEFIKRNAGFSKVAAAEQEVNTEPTEAQKRAGNYKMGHVRIDGFDVTIENPRGSVRRGTDASGKQWEQEMHNTYGYIRGTKGVDGDHIDVFLSDDPSQGDVFVVDQVNKDGTFDEHKVMYGFPDIESARKAYLSNYEDGWTGLGAITPVSKEEFKKWIDSSHRKTKPFAEYKGVKSTVARKNNAVLFTMHGVEYRKGDKVTIVSNFDGEKVSGTLSSKEKDSGTIEVIDNNGKAHYGFMGYIKHAEETTPKTDSQGNQLNEDGTLKLEKIASVDELTNEDFSKPTRSVELPALPKNVDEAIGANGKPVIIKKNILARNAERHADLTADDSRNILEAALYNPSLYGQSQKAKRPYNWIVINTKDKEGNNRLVLLELDPKKENAEIVHWHYIDDKGLDKIKRQAEREDGQLLILPSESEEAGALSGPTNDLSSAGKVRNNPAISQRNGVRKGGVEDYVSMAERRVLEEEANRTAAGFAMETREEAAAFDKRVPKMDDTELLAYMSEDGKGDVNKAHHPSVYDEYDYRHGDDQLQSYDATLVRLNESGTTLEQAEEMLANIQKDKTILATEDRAMLLGQEEALQEYISGLEKQRESEVAIPSQQTEQNESDFTLDFNRSKEEKGITTNPTSISHDTKGAEASAGRNSAGNGMDLFGNERGKMKKFSSKSSIDDVGDRLEGARKDMRRKIAESLANVTEAALIEKPFGKVYKKIDLKKAVESGALREKDAIFYEALFSMINQQKPRVTQSEMRSKRYIPDYKTKAERWAASTYNAIETIRLFMEADEAQRDALIDAAMNDRYPNKEKELAEIEQRKRWNPDRKDHKYEWGDNTTPNPLWVTYEVMNRMGYNVGDKLDIPFGVVEANTSGTGYSIKNLNGEHASLFGSSMSIDEAIDAIVYLVRLKRGDADISHPTQLFAFPATKSEMGESGRYRVMWGRDYKTREFDSKEEANAFASTKNGAYVSPINEVKRRFGYKVRFYHPLTGEKMFVDDAEFDTKDEAQAYFDGNFEKLNDAINAKLEAERSKKGEKKVVTADDVVHVQMVHSKDGGWTYAVLIDKKYANNDGMPYIIREGFANSKDAKDFADSIKDDALKTVLKHKEDKKKIVYFDTGENSRIGEDYRDGKDVDAEDFMNTFGFRGVQFGNWTSQTDRQMAVNQAYDAFMDMAKLIGVSPKAMSLNGELGIAFGARGVGGFAAHYERGEVVINLTKTNGAGSLAHEWWHALDNYFARRAGSAGDMVTDNRRIEMRDALRKAFNDMLDLVNGSDFAQRSAAKGEYWGRTHEITARLLSEWVDRELKKRGELNTFLSRGAVVERGQQHNYDMYEVLERLAGREPMPFEEYKELPKSLKGIPYPSAKEVEQFGGSLRHIFDTLEEKVDEETGNVMLYEPTSTYETRDGRKVVCRSLFDEMGVRSSDEVAMVSQHTQQGQGQNQVMAPSEIRLRKLKKGETCHVERVYEETRQFDFTGKEKVESAEDVAYIFRQLENAAVENSFLVLVKDGRPTVIHLGVGSYVNVVAPYEQALVAYMELKPEKVYFVHNHPSGVLKASRQDQELLKRVKMAFGEDVVQQGIIIDTTSGKYGEFDMVVDNYYLVQTSGEEAMPRSEGDEVPIKVYQFSRQVFAPGWNPESAFKVVSSQSVAEFVSSHRLGEHKKMSFLVVNNSGNVVANVFLPWTKLSDIKRSKDAGDLLAGYVHQCGGVRGVLYGNYDYEADDRDVLAAVGGRMRQLNAPLMDALHVEHSAYENGWAGVGEPQQRQAGAITDEHVEALNAKVKRTMQEDSDMMRSAAEKMGEKLHTNINIIEDVNEITHPNAAVQERRRKSKGWYDTATGKVSIVLPNNKSVDDVVATVGHEMIAHKGLRELVGEENYEKFLDEVYGHLRDDLKKGVDAAAGRAFIDDTTKNGERAKSYDQHRRTAVDELFGRLAEKPFEEFTDGERTLWQKLKSVVRRLLDKFLGTLKLPKWFELGDNELRYILWRSKERLERGKEHPIDLARDIVKREELGLGEDNALYSETKKDAHPTRLQTSDDAQAVQRDAHLSGTKVEINSENREEIDKNLSSLAEKVAEIQLPAEEFLAELRKSMKTESKDHSGYNTQVVDGELLTMRISDHHANAKHNKQNGEFKVVSVVIKTPYSNNRFRPHKEVEMVEYTFDADKLTHNNEQNIVAGIQQWLETGQCDIDGAVTVRRSPRPISEDNAVYRDSDDVWNDGSMGLQERMTEAATRLANNHQEDKKLRNIALHAIGGNLSDLRKAMSLQRTFDRTTVKRVADLARVLITNGYINNATSGDVKRLLSAVKNSVGRNDIEGNVQKVMDIMVDNQLKHAEETLHSLEAIKGSKVDARGVEVQGLLDPDGQTLIKAMKEAQKIVNPCGGKTHDEKGEPTAWGNALESAQMRMSSNDQAVADAAAIEYAGMQMAQQWFDTIQQSKLEEHKLRQMLKSGYVDENGNPIDNPQGKREWRANIEEAIRQNKIERVQAYYELVGRLTDSLRESLANAKSFKEAEKQRIREIQHKANSDMEGRELRGHRGDSRLDRLNESWLVRFGLSPLFTFDQFMRLFGRKNADGKGYLYDHYMRKFIDSADHEQLMKEKYEEMLQDKVEELFGTHRVVWNGGMKKVPYTYTALYGYVDALPMSKVTYYDGAAMREYDLSQAQLGYLYDVDKMLMGKVTNRRMGVTDEVMEQIADMLDPKLKEFIDWMQDDFLVGLGNECNEVHKRMFGANMANIEHYFPFVRDKNAIKREVENGESDSMVERISTRTGAIIKRTLSVTPWDLPNANILDVLAKHVSEMCQWSSYAELNRDLGTLQSYNRFKQQVLGMRTIYGSGENLWKRFMQTCAIVGNAYEPKRGEADKLMVQGAKGVTMGKIAFRPMTAMKQLLSLPAFFGEVDIVTLSKDFATGGIPSVKWAWENMPNFRKRIMSRTTGDFRLSATKYDKEKGWTNRLMQIASYGMLPNIGVDAWTIALGSHAVYVKAKRKYLSEGYSEERADRRAVQDAELCFNKSQQSSEGAYMAPVQIDHTFASTTMMLFRTSSTSYTRDGITSTRNLKRMMSGEVSVEFMAKQILRNAEIPTYSVRFDKELQQQVDGNLPVGHIYSLGMPGGILQSAGFPDAPIELSSTRLADKASQASHPFPIEAVKGLVDAMNKPIAVFKYGNNAMNVILGLEYNGKQFLVGVHFNQHRGGTEVSSVRGLFPKDNAEWLNWISQGKATYLDHKKIKALIAQQRINLADVDYLDLKEVTKVMENFVNPDIPEQKYFAGWREEDVKHALKQARKDYRGAYIRNSVNAVMFGYILPWLWRIGGLGVLLLLGNDDDEKEREVEKASKQSLFGPLEGLAYGDVLADALYVSGNKLFGDGSEKFSDLGRTNPFYSDLSTVLRKLDGDKMSAINDVLNMLVGINTGVNLQTVSDWATAILDYSPDGDTAREVSLLVARLLNAPQSQIEMIYFDEIGMSGEEASKLSPKELVERYAAYKVKRDHFVTPWVWGDEALLDKKRNNANKTIKERTEQMGDKKVNEAYLRYEEVYNRVDAEVRSAKNALKEKRIDYLEYAERMRSIQSDTKSWRVYSRFGPMDKRLDDLSERYLHAKSADEAAMCSRKMVEYKSGMVERLSDLR